MEQTLETRELLMRSPHNPLLTRQDWPHRINTVMNAAAAQVDGQTILLCRVEDRRGFSHLAVARSDDGETGWQVDEEALLQAGGPGAEWGVEDPRITWVQELDRFVIAYTAVGPRGGVIALATTTDFRSVELLGNALGPNDKNGALLPRRVDGRWVLFSRPDMADQKPAIWRSTSADLLTWEDPQLVMAPREGTWWDGRRIGIGPAPIETPHGWLSFYHGVRSAVSGDVYRVGAMLLDLDDPSRVLHRSEEWMLAPSEPWELSGDVPGVCFPCGAVADGDRVRLYYGAADTCLAMAEGSISQIVEHLLECPAE